MESLEFLFNQQKKLDKNIQYYFSLIKTYKTRKSTETADAHIKNIKKWCRISKKLSSNYLNESETGLIKESVLHHATIYLISGIFILLIDMQ